MWITGKNDTRRILKRINYLFFNAFYKIIRNVMVSIDLIRSHAYTHAHKFLHQRFFFLNAITLKHGYTPRGTAVLSHR